MELSTTNGHITIDYLFIYLSIPFVFPLVVRPAYSIAVLPHTVNNLFLHKVKAGFQMDGGSVASDVGLVLRKLCFSLWKTFL